jgi:hypothetical protein
LRAFTRAHGAHSNRPCPGWRYVSPDATAHPRCSHIHLERRMANANACAKRSLARSHSTRHSQIHERGEEQRSSAFGLTYCALVRDMLSVM